MIYSLILKSLETELAARKFPYALVYGPERVAPTTAGARPRIVIERDRQAGDQLGPPIAKSRHDPRMKAVRMIGIVIRVFAASTASGARVQDHEQIADQMIDMVHAAMPAVLNAHKTAWNVASARFLTADELKLSGLETWPGLVYEIRCSIGRGVYDNTWTVDAAPTATVGGAGGVTIGSSTAVQINGTGTPETACGG